MEINDVCIAKEKKIIKNSGITSAWFCNEYEIRNRRL